MLGMRLRKVPCDEQFRMRADALSEDLDQAAAVVATVGTTASTSVDPVPVIADELGIRCDVFVPRAAATQGNIRAIDAYDPDDVQEITDQLTPETIAAFMLRRLTS